MSHTAMTHVTYINESRYIYAKNMTSERVWFMETE